MEEQQQPLLSAGSEGNNRDRVRAEAWRSYEYLGRSSSARVPAAGEDLLVSGQEVRLAPTFSDSASGRSSYYPPSIHGALLTAPDLPPPPPFSPHGHDMTVASEGGHAGGYNEYHQSGYPQSRQPGRDVLDEVEIRQLLMDHVGHRCCWGSRPARRWPITAVEDCNVYVGTLETFIEERETITEKEPYRGGEIDKGAPQVGVWELDLRAEFPHLFVPHKDLRIKIPHSEAIHKCPDCEGRGEIACEACNGKEKQMTKCPDCYGRGLIAHRDGSDTICTKCSGKGVLACESCKSKGRIKCETCEGHASLLTRTIALVTWKTLSTRKVSAARGAASVPDEIFEKARGVQLCNIQAYQCAPAFFADSYLLNNFSSQVISSRSPVPASARVITERHIISVVPVTRVTMAHHKRSFSFYIVGFNRDVFIRDYPTRFCAGLCCCFDWLKI